MMIRALTLAAGLAAASTAQAGFLGWDMRVDQAATDAARGLAETTLDNATVYRMYAVWDDAGNVLLNVFNANFSITDGGTLYQDGFGANVAPNSAFFGFVPTLRYDSFVTVGELSNTGVTPVVTDPDFVFSATGVSAGGWANSNPPTLLGASVQNGSVWETLVGSFTVIGGGTRVPTTDNDTPWTGQASITFNSGIGTTTTQLADIGFIPTPGAMALFGLAGLTAARRRRSA